MAAIQVGNISAYDVYDCPRIAPKDIASFLAESRTGHEIPGAEPRRRAPWIDLNAPSRGGDAGEAYQPFVVPESRWRADALEALTEVDNEIAEENLPEIDDATKTEAGRLINALAWHPWGPTVYPTQDAEIAIHFKSPDLPDSVVLLLNNSGQADCYAYTGGRSRRSHYETSSDLPDAFVLDQLRRLMLDRTNVSAWNVGGLPFTMTFPPTSLPPTW